VAGIVIEDFFDPSWIPGDEFPGVSVPRQTTDDSA